MLVGQLVEILGGWGAVVICNFCQGGLGLNLSFPGCVAMGESEQTGTKVEVGIPCRSLEVLLGVCVWGLTHCCVTLVRMIHPVYFS